MANDSLKSSESDIAFLCTGGYLAARETFTSEVLAVPVVNRRPYPDSPAGPVVSHFYALRKDKPCVALNQSGYCWRRA